MYQEYLFCEELFQFDKVSDFIFTFVPFLPVKSRSRKYIAPEPHMTQFEAK